MKYTTKSLLTAGLVLAFASLLSAQTPAQVGNIYVGTCDSQLQNTQQNEIDVYDPTGLFVTSFHGPSQNACLNAMTFDAGDHVHAISARFGTQAWNVIEFDNFGNLLGAPGPYNAPSAITHDLQGNIFLAQGNIVKVDHNGNQTTYAVAGGATSMDLAADQHTMFYTAANGDVKSYDIVSRTQGPDIVPDALARTVRVLPDMSVMFDTLGAVQRWVPPANCPGCPYKQKTIFQIPANADNFALDPDGKSFWSINTYYDRLHQVGYADIYRTDIKTSDPVAALSLQPLTNGRYYSMSIAVNGDGMGSSAIATDSIAFPSRTVGTISNPKKAILTNVGVVQVIVTNVTITGDFAIKKNACAKGVSPGATCNISITFTPTAKGARTGTLRIFDNAGNSPQVVSLTGTGK